MDQQELEARVVEVLPRFASLEFQPLRRLVLDNRGEYSRANEELLQAAVKALMARGEIFSPAGVWGPFRMAGRPPAPQPPAKNGDRRPLSRLRVGKSR